MVAIESQRNLTIINQDTLDHFLIVEIVYERELLWIVALYALNVVHLHRHMWIDLTCL